MRIVIMIDLENNTMYKPLIYAHIVYKNFEINENGDIRNKSTNHIYKKRIDTHGYYRITLSLGKRGHVKSILIHKALAETFIANPKNYPIVNHIDENKTNISLSNLEWVTNKINTNKSLDNRYSKNPLANNRKLSVEDIKYIRENSTISNRKLAKIFNVSSTTISNIKTNKCYNGV